MTLKQDPTAGNTFHLQRVAENSIGNIDSSQLASLKTEKTKEYLTSTAVTTLLVTYIFAHRQATDG